MLLGPVVNHHYCVRPDERDNTPHTCYACGKLIAKQQSLHRVEIDLYRPYVPMHGKCLYGY